MAMQRILTIDWNDGERAATLQAGRTISPGRSPVMAQVIDFHAPAARLAHTTRRRFGIAPLAAQSVATLRLWRRRMREREALARWDDRDLRDAGITRAEILNEIAKPFWRG
jgi:uncharacterized protein YjiS (DUF1127 family)